MRRQRGRGLQHIALRPCCCVCYRHASAMDNCTAMGHRDRLHLQPFSQRCRLFADRMPRQLVAYAAAIWNDAAGLLPPSRSWLALLRSVGTWPLPVLTEACAATPTPPKQKVVDGAAAETALLALHLVTRIVGVVNGRANLEPNWLRTPGRPHAHDDVCLFLF